MNRVLGTSESAMERGPEHSTFHSSVAASLAAGAAIVKMEEEEEEEEIQIVHEKLSLPRPQSLTADLSMDIGAGSDEAAVLAAVAAAAERALAVDAPCTLADKEYWNAKSLTPECPRGCDFSGGTRYHYNIYFTGVQTSLNPLDKWIRVNLGVGEARKGGYRVCVLCLPSRRMAFYCTRSELLIHIQYSHPDKFAKLSRDYRSLFQGQVPDDAVHQLLCSPSALAANPSMVAVDAAPAAPSEPAPPAAVAVLGEGASGFAPPSILLNAPPSSKDEAFWNCLSTSSAMCPRGCITSATTDSPRRLHYKRYHYNIYYARMNAAFSRSNSTPLHVWLCRKFGDAHSVIRMCVKCAEETGQWIGYENRAELAIHIQSAHPSMFAELAQEYGSMVGGKIPDAQVHGILMNA